MILTWVALFISLAGFSFLCFCKFDEWIVKRQEFQILNRKDKQCQ